MTQITTSDFWQAALAGQNPPIPMNDPQPGFYRRKLVRNGPWVGGRIWFGPPADPETGELLDRSPRMQCEVAGQQRDPTDQWLWLAKHPIGEDDYRYLIAVGVWAVQHQPDAPEADPRRPVDFSTIPVPF